MFINCHTWLSFKYGTLSPENLFEEAKINGVKKICLTEINNTASYIELMKIIKERRDEHQLEIVLGMEFRQGDYLTFIALAQNNKGFENINRFRSRLNNNKYPVPIKAPYIENAFIIYPFGGVPPEELRENEFIGIRKTQLNSLGFHQLCEIFPDKYVILHPVTFSSGKTGFNLHRLLRAIDQNVVLSKLSPTLQAHSDEYMIQEQALIAAFDFFPSVIENTKRLLDQCHHTIDLDKPKNKKTFSSDEETDWNDLVSAAWEGFQLKYNAADVNVRERFNHELNMIRELKFCSYFLIAYDLVRWTASKKYDHVGRGSGANSMVAYCLGITNVDPVELDLYFERFLNTARTSPPDFDIDYNWTDRDHVYDYLFQKFGKNHCCLLATHVTFQSNSIIRELAKVFGLPKDEIDAMVDNPGRAKNKDHITGLIIRYASLLVSFPSGLSVHAGGVLITEDPIYEITATDLPPKGYPITHWDMYSAEDINVHKFDILSQRGIGHINDAVKIIKKNRNIDIDIYQYEEFKKDEKIKDLLRNGKSIGNYYTESPSMISLLRKLRCDSYLSLVAATSIIRPGVASSGMMRAYIERFHAVREGKDYDCIHPMLRELLSETYAIPIFQEDILKISHYFAGLTLTESDILRRGMSGKSRSKKEFERVKLSFFKNCNDRGYSKDVIENVWSQIEGFAKYSFAKGHSASYCVESFQSCFLKAHYPLEFLVGVIINRGGFYSTAWYVHEARMNGATIEAPCVNNSEYETIIKGTTIYLGFSHLNGIEEKTAKSIANTRVRYGRVYQSLQDFINHNDVPLEQITILIRIGAFRFTGKSKQALQWDATFILSQLRNKKLVTTYDIFEEDDSSQEFILPPLQENWLENIYDQIELLGFPLCDPFKLLQSADKGNCTAADLVKLEGKEVQLVGNLITIKYTKTKKDQLMYFAFFADAEGNYFDTVNFPNTIERYPYRGPGFYSVKGKVVLDFGVPSIQVSQMEKLPILRPVK